MEFVQQTKCRDRKRLNQRGFFFFTDDIDINKWKYWELRSVTDTGKSAQESCIHNFISYRGVRFFFCLAAIPNSHHRFWYQHINLGYKFLYVSFLELLVLYSSHRMSFSSTQLFSSVFRETRVHILSRIRDILTETFRVFRQALQTNARLYLKLGHFRFLPYTLELIVH